MSSLSDGFVPPFSPTTMDDSEKTCRVCRSGEEPGNPLYKPCKCSGSISWIHQDCLESWLNVSRTQRCELCKHPFKWEKVYASQAPTNLPPTLIARHLIRTIITGIAYFIRFLFVAFTWLALLPFSILWVWRGLFHLAKGWGTSWTAAIQEVEWSTIALSSVFMPSDQQPSRKNITATLAAHAAASVTPVATASQTALSYTTQDNDGAIKTLSRMINGTIVSTSVKPKVAALEDAISDLFKAWLKSEDRASSLQEAALNATHIVTSSNANLTSSWLPRSAFVDRALFASIEALSSKWREHKGLLYSVGEDIFSGQIIVACVVVAFIAAFLLREWVMANQPHAHAVDEPEPAPNVMGNVNQAQIRAVEEVMARFEEINARRGRGEGQDDARFPFGVEAQRELGLPPLEPIAARDINARRNDAENDRIREEAWASYDQGRDVPQSKRLTSSSLPFDYDGNEKNTSSRPTSPTPSDEETSAGLIRRRRAWGSERDIGTSGQPSSSATGSNFAYMSNDTPTSPPAQETEASSSGTTSPLSPIARPRTYSNDFGIESASEDEFDDEPLAAPVPGPIQNPARRPRVHDFDNDSDSEDGDEEDDLFGRVGAVDPLAPIAENDPAAFDGDDNPDDLFFEADLQGILEAVGIHGPIMALLQNVALVTLLIACLLVVSVWLPLMFGKTIAATNAQKIFLLPINFVRLFTDPLADRLVGLLGKRQDTLPTPTLKSRLLSALGTLGASSSSSSKPESLSRGLISQIQFYVQAYLGYARSAITAFILGGFRGIQNQWYAMAVGDSNLDRTLCIALGYLVIGAAAGAYLHHTQNVQAREAGVAVRDIVKQHFLLVKAAIFFFVEIVIFPTICGLLINLSTVPLIPESTISTRLAFYISKPVSSIFCTWLAGTNFMFSFAQMISIVRKCIRKGVLYFIRDPSDPEANPLREILETPAINQAKKITRSLFVYGGIIITCFGFFPWVSRLVPMGLFPLRWNMTRPLSIIPFDYIYLLTIVPITLGRAKPKRAIRGLFKRWCEFTCHQLRLSSFMLGKRIDDEEGTHVRRTWKAWLLLKKAPVPSSKSADNKSQSNAGRFSHDEEDDVKKKEYNPNSDVIFRKDGGFARTVASDQIKIVTKKMFVRTNIKGEPITEEGKEAIKLQLKEIGNDESKFTIVYIPPNFKFRILFFIFTLWLSCAIGIFIAFISPLIVGRIVLDLIMPEPLHDTYSIIAGIHVLTFLSTIYSFLRRRIQVYKRYQQDLSQYALGAHPAKEVFGVLSVQTIQLIILAINGGVIMPLLTGIAAHLYLIIPFEMIFGSVGSDGLHHVSFIMDWCYGVVIIQLACRIAGIMKENRLSRVLREVKNNGIRRNASLLNRYMFKINRALLLSICMPLLVTHSHRLTTTLIWRYLLRSSAPPPPSTYNQAYVFKIALLSVSGTGSAVLLSGPAKRLSKKWSATVWEKEFVVKRKLRNIDDAGLDSGGTNGDIHQVGEGGGHRNEEGDEENAIQVW